MSHRDQPPINFQLLQMERDDDDFGEGFISESHPLRPTSLTVPLRDDSRAPSISSSVSDLDAPIYPKDSSTTIPSSGSKEDIQEHPGTPTALAPTTKRTENKDVGFNGKLLFAIIAAVFGSAFQHGYNTGVINIPAEIIKAWIKQTIAVENSTLTSSNSNVTDGTDANSTDAKLTTLWALMASMFCLGGMFGGCLVKVISERFGVKKGLLLNNIFVLITVILEGVVKTANSVEILILSRFVIGVNSGLNAGMTPMYLNEISPSHLRGAIGTVYQLIIVISILIAQVLGLKSILGTEKLWPILFMLTIIPAIFQCITLPFCPESPKYSIKTNEAAAQKGLAWLRDTNDVFDELEEIKAEHEADKLTKKPSIKELITNSSLRMPLIIAVMVMFAQQFSGINAVMFFSSDIFSKSGLSPDASQQATIGIGVVNVIMTVVSLLLVEKCGRKTLLFYGFVAMAIDTSLLTISLVYAETSSTAQIFSILFIILYIVIFATGAGSIPWFLVSELFNTSARAPATAIAIAINWGANFLVTLTFPGLQASCGAYVFIIFVVLQVLFAIFIYFKVPETKNKTIEEISSMFRQRSYQ